MRINRRQALLGGVAASAAAMGLAGPAAAQDVRLRYFFWGGPGRSDRKVETTTKFAATQAGLTVDSEWASWGDYWPRLSTQIAGGNPPDLIQMDYRYIYEYARRGVLMPLDEFVPAVIKATDFGEQRLEAGRVDGQLFGITIGDNALGLGYDMEAWAAAGVDLTNDMTWADFRERCAAFKAANAREDYYATNNSAGSETALEVWLRQKGRALYVADGLGFDETDAAEWFAFWLAMSADGLAPPADVQAMQQPNPESNLLTLGYVASSPLWSNELNPIQQLLPAELGIVPLPVQEAGGLSGAYLKPSQFMSISALSANPARAAEVINYLTNTIESARDIGVETAIPPSAAVRDAIAPTLDETARKSLDFVTLMGERGDPLPIPPLPGAGEITQVITDVSLQVMFGSLSPEEGGAQLVRDAQDILARA